MDILKWIGGSSCDGYRNCIDAGIVAAAGFGVAVESESRDATALSNGQ